MLQYLIHQREWSLTLSLQRSRLNDKDHWVRIFFPLNLYFITLSVFSHDDWIVLSIERDFTNFQIFQKLHFVNSIIWRYLNHFNISHDGTFIWRRKNKHTHVHTHSLTHTEAFSFFLLRLFKSVFAKRNEKTFLQNLLKVRIAGCEIFPFLTQVLEPLLFPQSGNGHRSDFEWTELVWPTFTRKKIRKQVSTEIHSHIPSLSLYIILSISLSHTTNLALSLFFFLFLSLSFSHFSSHSFSFILLLFLSHFCSHSFSGLFALSFSILSFSFIQMRKLPSLHISLKLE